MKQFAIINLLLLFCLQGFAQRQGVDGVIIASEFHKTRPIREIFAEMPVDETKIFKEKGEESEDRKNRKPQKFKFSVKDGLQFGNEEQTIQRKMGDVTSLPVRANWAGQTTGGLRPFDPSGAVGPNHYVQMINSTTFKVYDKSSGAVLLTGTLGNLWSPATANAGDPIVMYDKAADRWFLAQFGNSTDKKIYIAVSQTSDPTGAYYTYTYVSPQFPDYLKFGVWADGYYMTSNQGTQKVFSFNRAEILAGTPGARSIYVNFAPPKSGFFCPLPGDAADGTLPQPGTPCPIFSYSDNGWGAGYSDAVNIYQMAVDWTPVTPTASITLAANLPTALFDASYDVNWNDCPQPGTTQKLDGIGGACMYRAQWKSWNGYNTILLNWGVKINATQRGIKWCELRQNQSNNTWSIYQEGIYAPDAATRWMGSMAMDNYGSIGLSYLKSDAISIYPGLYYTGRRSCDPLGTLPVTEEVVVAGSGYQTGLNRVGDYAHTTLDMDGVTFWSTSEYMGGPSGSGAAKTRIFSYQINPCGDVASVAISLTVGTNPGCLGNPITFTATPINGGTAPSYQWKVNGVNVGTNSQTYTTSSLNNGQVVSCVMTSNLPGVLGSPATSNSVVMTLSPITTPAISIVMTSGTNPSCPGTNLTFTATASNAGAVPTYQWKVNGVNVGANTPTYSSPVITDGQVVTCTVTSTLLCSTVSTITSNPITVQIAAPDTPSVTVAQTTGSNPFCEGSEITFTATPSNAINPIYQWLVNGQNTGTNSALFSTSTLSDNDVVSCQISSSNGCPSLFNMGNGTMTNSTISDLAAAYPTYYGNGRQQYIMLATDLIYQGVAAGNITSIAFNVSGSAGNPASLNGYTIKLGATSSSVMSTTFKTPTFTTVFGPLNYTPNLNSWNTHTFSTPYYWDGTSNIVIDICFANGITGTAAYQNAITPTPYLATAYYHADGSAGLGACNMATATATGFSRPTMKFTQAPPVSVTSSNTITVHTNPVVTPAISITQSGGSNPSCTGSAVSFTATALNGGNSPSFQWQVDGFNTGSNSDTFSTSTLNNSQIVRCVLTSSENCPSTPQSVSNDINMVINASVVPTVSIAISNGNNPSCIGSAVTFTATTVNGGLPSYQWKVNGNNSGTDSVSFTTSSLTDGDIVTCEINSTIPCASPSIATSNSIVVNVNSSFTPSVSIQLTNGSNPSCQGSPMTFEALGVNGGTPVFQWKIDGNNVGGNTNSFTSSSLLNGQSITCEIISSLSCTSISTAVSNSIMAVINPIVSPSVSIAISNGGNPSCAGSSISFTATPLFGGTPSYQWKVDGLNVGTNSEVFTTSTLQNGQWVTCEMTTSELCADATIVVSNAIQMTILPVVSPSVSIAINNGSNPTCQGSSITFEATPTNGGVATYQWMIDGMSAGLNNPTLTTNNLTNGQQVSCLMTTSETCVTSLTALSNTLSMTVNPMVTPTVSIAITGGSNPACVGTSVTFTANPQFGGTPSYQWKINGLNAGTNSPNFTTNTLNNMDIITCVMNSTQACATNATATSNAISMTINSLLTPFVSIVISNGSNPMCEGSAITFYALQANGGLPSYQWKVNGVNAGTNSPTFTLNAPSNGNTVSCLMTSSEACVTSSTALSNTVTLSVNPILTPSVSIALSAGTNPSCAGSSLSFTATPINGGSAPIYQWQENGVNVGLNSSTYTTNSMVNGTVLTCMMSSSAGCLSAANATSNAIALTVNPIVTPTVSIAITNGTNPACTGSSITFTAAPTNGGTPSYQWKVNGVNTGTNTPTFTSTTLANSNIVTCVMTSNASCISSPTATSNAITRLINPTVTPSVVIAITGGTNPTCSSASVTFTATATNGGPTPSYQWKISGVNAGTNSPTFTTTTLTNNKIVTCVMTTSASCVTATTATSNAITMSVTNSVVPTVSVAITSGTNPMCAGSAITFKASATNGGTPVYQWKVNGTNVGTNNSSFSSSSLTNGQVVTCTMTSSATCAIPSIVTSSGITMVVNPIVTPSVSIAITGGTNPNCSGSSITFTATPVNGGTSPSYQWKSGNTNVGTNSPVFTSSTLTNGKVIKCVMTSSAPCKTANTTTSNSITLAVSASLVPAITIAITGGTNPFCPGSQITFTATTTNGGTPTFQWKVNGINAGTNSPIFSTNTLIAGQIVSCQMTSSLSCASPASVNSNSITMVHNGCLAPDTIKVPVGGPSNNPIQTVVSCDTYYWPMNGITYSSSGSYSASFTNIAGYDSSYTLNLTLLNSTSSSVSASGVSSYFWAVTGLTYFSSGIYIYNLPNQVGCDSTIILDLILSNGIVNANGSKAAATHLISSKLPMGELSDKTFSLANSPFDFDGIKETRNDMVVYPNPVNKFLTLLIPMRFEQKEARITVLSSLNEIVFNRTVILGAKESLDLSNLPDGLYLLFVCTDEGVTSKQISILR